MLLVWSDKPHRVAVSLYVRGQFELIGGAFVTDNNSFNTLFCVRSRTYKNILRLKKMVKDNYLREFNSVLMTLSCESLRSSFYFDFKKRQPFVHDCN